jgi:hypothetical protein
MIEPSGFALLMAAVGFTALLAAGFFTAVRATIPLPTVTMTTKIKNHAATEELADPLTENGLTGPGHRCPEADLDNRRRSWQDVLTVMWRSLIGGRPIKNPGCSYNRGFSFRLRGLILPNSAIPENACGDDVNQSKRRPVFKFLRFYMRANSSVIR